MALVLGPQCCCEELSCDSLAECAAEYDTAEIILDGIVDGTFCGSCENINDTFLTDAQTGTTNDEDCCYSWGHDFFPTVCIAASAYVGLLIQYSSGVWKISVSVNYVETNIPPYLMESSRWGLSGSAAETAITALCNGEQVELPYLGSYHYAAGTDVSIVRECGLSTSDGTIGAESGCDATAATCLVQLS